MKNIVKKLFICLGILFLSSCASTSNLNQKVYDTILHAGRTCLILGGEKGLSVDEEELLIKAKFKAISLGENIFRSITAALTSTVVFTFLREKIDRKK